MALQMSIMHHTHTFKSSLPQRNGEEDGKEVMDRDPPAVRRVRA